MPNSREGYKRVTGEIPNELYDKIKEFNKTSTRPINVSKVIENCLKKKWETVEKELVENGGVINQAIK